MLTESIYLTDSYAKEMDAKVMVVEKESDQKYKVILDKTVFYPIGGGQPTDQGYLAYGGNKAEIYLVIIKDGEIWHHIKTDNPPVVGDVVHGTIDWERRYKNMRLHSGGHVIDFAMYLLGYSPKTLQPLKGDHGKKPYIAYQGTIEQDIRQRLEDKSNELVTNELKFSCEFKTLDEVRKSAIYVQPGLPTNKSLRMLKLEGVGAVADGGTQVANTKEVGRIQITSVEKKGDQTIVSYLLG
ncbi:MAG: alanyl-tRNA editing protein [Candidatus Micrarchaeota archaeon]|nr:alanyl-tRNA editing protein [Candidatus Micrarchaeota archaeon]